MSDITPSQSFAGQMTSMMAIWYVDLLFFMLILFSCFRPATRMRNGIAVPGRQGSSRLVSPSMTVVGC